jgi:hypothetical protein
MMFVPHRKLGSPRHLTGIASYNIAQAHAIRWFLVQVIFDHDDGSDTLLLTLIRIRKTRREMPEDGSTHHDHSFIWGTT